MKNLTWKLRYLFYKENKGEELYPIKIYCCEYCRYIHNEFLEMEQHLVKKHDIPEENIYCYDYEDGIEHTAEELYSIQTIYYDGRTIKEPSQFYKCYAWIKLRKKIFKKYGKECMKCGKTEKDNIRIHADHIKPRSLYPDLELEEDNIQVLCLPCNVGKGNRNQADYR